MEEIPRLLNPLRGQVFIEGDKSIAYRAILLAPLAPGSTIENLPTSPLIFHGLKAIEILGSKVNPGKGGPLSFAGYNLSPGHTEIDCGGSATLMRLLAGLLSGFEGEWKLTGNGQLSKRPMDRVAEPLRLMGASIETDAGRAPVSITGGKLKGIEYKLPVQSAQLKSALLLAGINAEGTTKITERSCCRDHTERLMRFMGLDVTTSGTSSGNEISIRGPNGLNPVGVFIPGDISSAVYLMVLALLTPGSDIVIKDVLLNPTRMGCIEHLRKMGADIGIELRHPEYFEPYGNISVSGKQELRNVPIQGEDIVALLDELPLLSMLGAFCDGPFSMRGAAELRYKETDRLRTTVHNLRAMGVDAEEFDDGFEYDGGAELHSARFDSFDDHRIALSCMVTGMHLGGCKINHGDVAMDSFPWFERHVQHLSSTM